MSLKKVLIAIFLALVSYPTIATHSRLRKALYQIAVVTKHTGYVFSGKHRSNNLRFMDEVLSGSAVAVAKDGYLLTARHVVDISGSKSGFCYGFGKTMNGTKEVSVLVESIQVTLFIMGVGGAWMGEQTMEFGDFCDGVSMPKQLWTEDSSARIVSLDTKADLALLKFDGLSLGYLDFYEGDNLQAGKALKILGFVDGEKVKRRRAIPVADIAVEDDATYASPCEPAHLKSFFPSGPVVEPIFKFNGLVNDGMSGGPVVSDNRLVGVTVMKNEKELIGMAITGDYVREWYRFQRGWRPDMPSTSCE